ncbi:hypothetical protein VIGAN_07093100, partial [Vigna angularis var. angularis]
HINVPVLFYLYFLSLQFFTIYGSHPQFVCFLNSGLERLSFCEGVVLSFHRWPILFRTFLIRLMVYVLCVELWQ